MIDSEDLQNHFLHRFFVLEDFSSPLLIHPDRESIEAKQRQISLFLFFVSLTA